MWYIKGIACCNRALSQTTKLSKKIYGFDSFEGFNEEVKIDIDLGGNKSSEKKIGGFNSTSYNYVQNLIKGFKLKDKIKIYKGYFEYTLSNVHEKNFHLFI